MTVAINGSVSCFVVYVSRCTRFSYIFTPEFSAADEATQDKSYGSLDFDASCCVYCTWRYVLRLVGTVENYGNMEIMETVIFVKGHNFAKMPCF